MEETALEEKGLSDEEIRQERENKLNDIRETLYGIVDDMVEVLDTVNIEDFIQIHIMGNDFTQSTAILHDISCEMNLDTLRHTDVKTSVGFDQILKVQKQIFDLSMPLGELLINSEKKLNPKGAKLQRLIKKMARSESINEDARSIVIHQSRSRTEPHLNPSGLLFVPYGQVVNDNQISLILSECARLFDIQTAAELDRRIGLYNAQITQSRMEQEEVVPSTQQEVIVTSSHPAEEHNFTNGYLRLNPFRLVEDDDMDALLSEAEALNYNVDNVRRFIIEHNEHIDTNVNIDRDEPGDVAQNVVRRARVAQPEAIDLDLIPELESRINFSGVSIRDGRIHPQDVGYIGTDIQHGLAVAGRVINETTERLVRRIIVNHNQRILDEQEVDVITDNVDSTGFSGQNITREEDDNGTPENTPDERTP